MCKSGIISILNIIIILEALIIICVRPLSQGTNAHVLLRSPSAPVTGPPGGTSSASSPALPWSQRERYWVAAQAHGLISSASTLTQQPPPGLRHHRRLSQTARQQQRVTFQVSLSHPSSSYLWDHVVSGRPVCPAAAFLEIVTAAARLAMDPSGPWNPPASRYSDAPGGMSQAAAAAVAVLSNVEIPSPLLLGGLATSSHQASTQSCLECVIDLESGVARLSSVPRSSSNSNKTERHYPRRSRSRGLHRRNAEVLHLQGRISWATAADKRGDVSTASSDPVVMSSYLASSAHPLVSLGIINRLGSVSSGQQSAAAPLMAGLDIHRGGGWDTSASCFHPAALDSALQLGALPWLSRGGGTFVPVGLAGLVVPLHSHGVADWESDAFATAQSGPAALGLEARADFHMMLPGWDTPLALLGLKSNSLSPSAAASPVLPPHMGGTHPSLSSSSRPLEARSGSAALSPKTRAEATAAPALKLMYEVQWVASEATLAPEPTKGSDMDIHIDISRKDNEATSSAASSALALVQAASLMMPSMDRFGLGSYTPGDSGGVGQPPQQAAAGSLLDAFVRCAVLEDSGSNGGRGWSASRSSARKPVDPLVSPGLSLTLRDQSMSPLHGRSCMSEVQMVPQLTSVPAEGLGLPSDDFRLVPRPPGSLGSLVPEPVPPPPMGKDLDGVSVRVRAVGLNFRDLLVVSPYLKIHEIVEPT